MGSDLSRHVSLTKTEQLLTLFGRMLLRQINKLVDGLSQLEQLVTLDEAISVQVIDLEGDCAAMSEEQ